jgi:formate dehydrogenase maturation protein FdhE
MAVTNDRRVKSPSEYKSLSGVVCPVCGTSHISGNGRTQTIADGAYQPIKCDECESTWNDVYTLSGYDELSLGEDL